MKNIFLFLFVLLGLSACTKVYEFPMRPVSFETGGKTYYSARDMRTRSGFMTIPGIPEPDTLRVTESNGCVCISYERDTDFLNHDIYRISFGVKWVEAAFETGKKISFDLNDNLEEYPHLILTPIKTSNVSDYDQYRAVKGWIEFDKIDRSTKTVSGRFEFNAVLEDDKECSHDKEIEVKNGSFKNLPYANVKR